MTALLLDAAISAAELDADARAVDRLVAATEPAPSIVLLLLAGAALAWAYYLDRHQRARHEESIERGIESGHLTEAHRSAPTILVWGTVFLGLVLLFAAVAAAWR